MYYQKCSELLPLFNSLETTSEIEYSLVDVNEFANVILRHNINKIVNVAELQNDFNSVEANFNGLLREYLLSRILYAAYNKHLIISTQYLEKYNALGSTGYYQKILKRIISDQSITDEKVRTSTNYLYSMNKNEIITLENIIANNKGKVIFLDLMASWCIPCREDLPLIKKMEEGYSKNDIVFINLSFDQQYQPWKKYIYSSRLEKNNSFMFVNINESPLVSEHKIESIPRYLIFDKKGILIDSNAPRPQDGKLKIQLDSLVNSHL
jgi:thiol-disulfide isomerase/thioredoxin